eukprot:COSAG02_NODE_809_length_16922_cov_11.295013_13_plen_1654_part_00
MDDDDRSRFFVGLAAGSGLAAWGGASLASSGWAAVAIVGALHLPTLAILGLIARAYMYRSGDITDDDDGKIWLYLICSIAIAAPLCVVVAPPIALWRLGLGQLGVSIGMLAILALSAVYLWHQSKSGNLRETYHGPEDKAAEQEAEDGVKADQMAAAKDGAKMMRAAVFPPVAEVPTGSGKMIFGITLEVVTLQSIAFMPSMPTLNLDFRGVPEWARWWVDMNTMLKAVLGDFAAIFGSFDLQTWLTGLIGDVDGPSVNLYLVKFAAIVICSCVLFPWHMRRLGVKKTSADQAAFVVIAFEAAAMFTIKNIAGGLICTDYSDRHFVTMQSVIGNPDFEAGAAVYLTTEGFTATEPTVDAAVVALGWVYWAVVGGVFVLGGALFGGSKTWSKGAPGKLRYRCIYIVQDLSLTSLAVVPLLAIYGGIRASSTFSSSDYLYGRTLSRTWHDSAIANATAGCPLSVNASEAALALENCTLHPVQVEGAWLDDAGWAPSQAIKCSWSTQHVLLIYVALVAFAVYLGQVLYFAVIYGKKSSVIVFDQRYMLCSLLLKMALSVATAAIGTCHPNRLLVIEGVVVGANLVMLLVMSPCNIRMLDHIKVVGLYNVLFTLSVTGWVAVVLSGGNEPCSRDERYAAAEAVDSPLQTQVLCIGGLFFAVVFTPMYIALRKRLDSKKDAKSKTLRGIFDAFDADRSGTLDKTEAKEFCASLGKDVAEFEREWELLNPPDSVTGERDDTVSFDEFEQYYNEHATDAPSQLTITDFNYSNITQALTRLLPSTEETDEEQQPLWRQLIPSEITAIVEKAAQALEFATRLVGRLCNRSKVGVSQRAATRATAELKKEADDMVKGRKFADAAKAYGEAAELDPDEESSNNLRELEARAKQRIPKLTIDVSEYTGTEQLEPATLRMLIASEAQVDFVGLDITSEGAQIMLKMLDERPVQVKLKRLENKLRRVASLGMLGAPPMSCGGPVAVSFRKLVFRDEPEKALNSLTKLSGVVGQLSSENSCPIKLLRPDLSALRDMTFAVVDVDARDPTFWTDAEVFKELTDSLKTSKVTEVDFSSCGIGPIALGHLSDWVREATAAVTSINCLANKFGEEDLATLLTAIEGTSVRSLCGLTEGQTVADFSGQNLGAIDVKIMAAEYGFQGFIAALNSVTIDGNTIGCPSGATVKPGAETGVVVKEGVFVAVDGRFGEVVCLRGSSSVDIQWLDDGSRSNYIQNDKLTSVVASRTDLIEDYSHIRSLGEAVSGSKLKTYGLANCQFNPVSLATFVESVRWADAALNSLKCANNPGMVGDIWPNGRLKTPDAHAEVFKELTDNLKTSQVTEVDFSSCGIGPVALGHLSEWVRDATAALTSINCLANKFEEDDLATLLTAIEGTSVRSLCGLTEGQTAADFSGQNLGPMDVKIMAAEYEFQGFIAALTSITLDGQPLSGTTLDYSWLPPKIIDIDADLSGFKLLCEAMASSQIEVVSMKSCYLGPQALTSLADAIKLMAAIASLTISGNFIFGSTDVWTGFSLQTVHDVDKDQSGWNNLCEQLKGSNITSFTASDIGMGPVALRTLATSLPAAVNSVTVDSTGQMGDQKTYTLTGDEDKIELANKNLGPADINLISAWLATNAGAALTEVGVHRNKGLDEVAVAALRATAPETCKIIADY